MGPIMQKRAERMYVLPGNHESEADIARFSPLVYGFHDFHGTIMDIAGYHVAGLGYSNPTPFDTPGENSGAGIERAAQHKFGASNPLVFDLATCCRKARRWIALLKGSILEAMPSLYTFNERSPGISIPRYIHQAAGQYEMLGSDRGLERRKTRPVAGIARPGKIEFQ